MNKRNTMTASPWLGYGTLALVFAVHVGVCRAVEPTAAPKAEETKTQAEAPPKAEEAKTKKASDNKGKKKEQKPAAPPPAAAEPKLNAIAQTARNAGVVNCLGPVQEVTEFLTAKNKSGAFLFLPPADANRHLLSTSLEVQSGGASSYVGASVAPLPGGGCGALYEAVSYWANDCNDVASKVFTALPAGGKLGETITMLDGGANLRVFLMPVGSGCLSIKKEVIY
jgi:hypothetical protein